MQRKSENRKTISIPKLVKVPPRTWLDLSLAFIGLAGFFAFGAAESVGTPLGFLSAHLKGVPACLAILALSTGTSRSNPLSALFLAGLLASSYSLLAPSLSANGTVWPPLAAARAMVGLESGAVSGWVAAACYASLTCGWRIMWARLHGNASSHRTGWERMVHLGFIAILAGQVANGFGSGQREVAVSALISSTSAVLAWYALKSLQGSPEVGTGVRSFASFFVPGLLMATFLLIQLHGMGPTESDENIYFYQAWELSQGRLPYRDFFLAHPPIRLLIPALIFKFAGFSLGAAKAIAPLLTAFAGIALWMIARREFGALAAGAGMAAFLFSSTVLETASFLSGMEHTVLFLVLATGAFLGRRDMRAGFWLGLALVSGVYSAALVCGLVFLSGLRGVRHGLHTLLSAALVFLSVNGLCLLIGGSRFLDSVYLYHFLKPSQILPGSAHGAGWNVAVLQIHGQPHLWLSLPLAAFLALCVLRGGGRLPRLLSGWARGMWLWEGGREGKSLLLSLTAVAFLIQASFFKELYGYYFMPVYPFFALLFGFTVAASWDAFRSAAETGVGSWRVAGPGLAAAAALGAAGCLSLLIRSADGVRADRADARWEQAPVFPSLSGAVRLWIWEPPRARGTATAPAYLRYLWDRQVQRIDPGPISEFLRNGTSSNETLVGSSTLAPLFALQAGRRLAAGEADNNGKRFRTGLLTEEDYWRSICSDGLKYIVASGGGYFNHDLVQGSATVGRWFKPARPFAPGGAPGASGSTVMVLVRKDPKPNPVSCIWEGS